MKNPQPLVSVLVPVYGVELYIEQCARALFSQTYSNLEYIFVDDGSPDRSIEILQDVLAGYPERAAQVRIIRHERNQGLPNTRNTALEYATGEWVLMADSDDWTEPDLVEQLVAAVDADDVDMVSCHYYSEFSDGCQKEMAYSEMPPTGMGWLRLTLLDRGIAWALWSRLVRRSLFMDYGLRFVLGANLGEDMGIMLRLCCHVRSIRYVALPLIHYRIRTDSLSKRGVVYEDRCEAAFFLNMTSGLDYIRRQGLLPMCEREMARYVLRYKFMMLKYAGLRYERYIRDLMPESNRWIWRRGMELSLRKRLTVWAGVRGWRKLLRMALHRNAPGRNMI